MPLSEHEQRLLEQMERALYAEDPKLASALRGADQRANARRRIVLASVGLVVGIAVLMTGVIIEVVPLSVVGFVLFVGAAFVAVSTWRSASTPGSTPVPGVAPPTAPGPGPSRPSRPGRAQRAPKSGGFMERFEERWNRRREEDGR